LSRRRTCPIAGLLFEQTHRSQEVNECSPVASLLALAFMGFSGLNFK